MAENTPPQGEQHPQPQQPHEQPAPETPQPPPAAPQAAQTPQTPQAPQNPQSPQGHAWWQQSVPPAQPPHEGTPPQGMGPSPYTVPLGAPAPAGPRAKRRVSMPIVATAIIAGLIGGGAALGGAALFSDKTPPVLTSEAPSAANVSSKPGSVEYAAEVAMKSTVDIKVATGQGTATGTGIILTQDGYVLTNNHVVSGAGRSGQIQVSTPDGKKLAAKVTGTAPSYDLAVIKLDGASGLTPAKIGQSSTLKVGQPVAAIGSPEQLSNTVTSGIVSALSRTVTASDDNGGQVIVYNGLQTDAPINPGNSGGPLVNMDGQVVGVNSAVDTGQKSQGGLQSFGLGFSIPIDTAKRVANELMQSGKATKPVLGVTGTLGSQRQSASGAPLADVQQGGAAAAAGIKPGDTVTKLDNTALNSYADLQAEVLKHTPGQQVPITVKHADGSEQTMTVTLGSTTDTQQTTITPQQSPFGNGFGGN
ncbi:S1C family serine protease [Amycolatopsis samaneae]|uniref:S1C family serine protease n=1 Tax=Amycolatopsis samaneae TaxID=664691 RepID=A0ABW5GNT8_9PSEU